MESYLVPHSTIASDLRYDGIFVSYGPIRYHFSRLFSSRSYRPTIRLPGLDSIRPLSITDALVKIPSVLLLFMCVLWKQEFYFSTGKISRTIRRDGDRYSSNDQVLQKSRVFVEATNEIADPLSMSEERPHHSDE